MTSATLHTNHGAIAVELFDDDAPIGEGRVAFDGICTQRHGGSLPEEPWPAGGM